MDVDVELDVARGHFCGCQQAKEVAATVHLNSTTVLRNEKRALNSSSAVPVSKQVMHSCLHTIRDLLGRQIGKDFSSSGPQYASQENRGTHLNAPVGTTINHYFQTNPLVV